MAMNNPYSNSSLRRLKRTSKMRYAWVILKSFPAYIAWLISRLLPEESRSRLYRRLKVLGKPFQSITDFLGVWVATRDWKKLFVAVPIIVALIWIQSSVFLAKSQTDEEMYGDYRQTLLKSSANQEYELADFLTGKLLAKGVFKNDDQLYYAAMIAAHENGNIPRRDLLLKRLTQERNHAPAHMWYANLLLNTRNTQGSNTQKAIQHMLAAFEESEDNERLRMQLAQLYYQAGRLDKAIGLLEDIKTRSPRSRIFLARVYLANDRREEAVIALNRVLEDLELENPDHDKFLGERIDANVLLIAVGAGSSQVRENLIDTASFIENKMSLSSGDKEMGRLLSANYMGLAQEALGGRSAEERIKALEYFEKAIKAGHMASNLGRLLCSASNIDSGGGLSDVEMRQGLVQGVGVSMAHVFLALDAWKKGLTDDVKFHLGLAFAHESGVMLAVEQVARHVGRVPAEGNLSPFRLLLDSQPLWKRAIGLLDVVQKIDESSADRCLLAKCAILSERQRWADVTVLIESSLGDESSEQKLRLLGFLVRAYGEIGDRHNQEKYAKVLKKEREALQAQD